MKYLVNVRQEQITPFVVEAEDEWEAMVKAKDGEGYIHETGSMDVTIDPKTWEVQEYLPARFDFYQEWE